MMNVKEIIKNADAGAILTNYLLQSTVEQILRRTKMDVPHGTWGNSMGDALSKRKMLLANLFVC